MKKVIYFFISIFIFFSCSNRLKEQSSSVTNGILSEDDAKEIVAKYISESDVFQQYYVIDSENFDERVCSISWGDTVLINVIPDGIRYTEEKLYYLVTGILPNGQLLAAQAVDAVSGEIIQWALRNNKNSSTLKFATKKQCDEYLSRIGFSEKKTEAIYYYDGSINTENLIYSWKYCINTNENRSLSEGASLNDCVFLDPWVISELNTDERLTVDNAFFSKMGYKHRTYKINSDKNFRSLMNYHNEFEPID